MLVSDGAVKSTCGITPKLALNLMQPLHAMIDSESKATVPPITGKELETCTDNCHCGIYSDLTADSKLKNDLYEKARTIQKHKLITCAEVTSKWLCNDPLLMELKAGL